jgi:putative membrane protein
MTIFMLATQRFLPRGQRYALPPEVIVKDLAHRAHIRSFLSKRQIMLATLISHFGYGSAMGAAYGPMERAAPLPAPARGLVYGLLIWVGSYFALLPLGDMAASGQKEPGQRNLMMLAAHALWGITLGSIVALLKKRSA